MLNNYAELEIFTVVFPYHIGAMEKVWDIFLMLNLLI
jgi:hypothetical protein